MTEREDASTRAGFRERLLEAALHAAPEGVAVIHDASIVFANRAFAELFGAAELESLPAPLGPIVRDFCARAGSSNARAFHGHVVMELAKRRSVVDLAISPRTIHGVACHIIFVRASGAGDIPASSQSDAERLVSLGRIAESVLHDIKNPLAYVLGSIEVAERCLEGPRESPSARALDSGILEAVTNARLGVERLREIVLNLLPFSGPMIESKSLIDVESVLDSSIKVAWNAIRHRARLVKRYGGVPPILGDESRLGRVFVNLLVNAAEAVGDAKERAEIVLTTRTEGDRVLVEVLDSGAGLDEGEVHRLFEREPDDHPAPGSATLGLSVCRSIVASYGGEVSVEGSKGGGALFRVALPCSERHGESNSGAESKPGGSADGARILVVDDEPLLGQTLSFAFADRHEVVVAASGREALALLARDTRFDLVLCDLMMPDVSGQKVYQYVEANHPELVPRFVFMSGGAFTESAQNFLEAHPGRRLEKPFTILEIERLLLNPGTEP